MGQPRISIVTPSYNQVEFIEKNLRSVYSQSYDNIEHVVIDGGSDDGTVEVLRDYEDKYNLKWVSEPDNGQTHALNKGIQKATGDWIGWQNSDDYYLPDAFENLANTIDRKNPVDAIYGDVLIVDQNGEEISAVFTTRPSKFVQRYWSLFASNQSLFVASDTLDSIWPLDEDLMYTMDASLTWKLLDGAYDLVQVPKFLGAFRVHEAAKTYNNVNEEQRAELNEIYDSPWYESLLPRPVLQTAAKSVKLGLLIRGGRWNALKYNLAERVWF